MPVNRSDRSIRSQVAHFLEVAASSNPSIILPEKDRLVSLLELDDTLLNRVFVKLIEGTSSFYLCKYEDSIESLTNGVAIGESVKDEELNGLLYFCLGMANRSIGNIDLAVSSFLKGISLIEKEGEFSVYYAYCFYQLGEIHVSIKEFQTALSYYLEAIAFIELKPQKTALFRSYNGLGGCYLHLNMLEECELFLQKSLSIEGLSPAELGRGKNDLGLLYIEKEQFESAESELKESLKIRLDNGLDDAASTSMIYLAGLYSLVGKINEGIDVALKCQNITDKYQTKWKQVRVIQLLAELYYKNEDFNNSAHFYTLYDKQQSKIRIEQEHRVFKLKNEQIEFQKEEIQLKHNELESTLEEVKRLKVNRKAMLFSWVTVVVLVILSETLLDPFIEDHSYNDYLSLIVKVFIALMFKPIDGLYERLLWKRAINK